MSNKNKNLILAYFDSKDVAEGAAKELKHWDKHEHHIKLGGMGIITLDKKGKLETHKVGARAAGTGAKWGGILGATGGLAIGTVAAVGLVTGGLALVPVAVGVGIGVSVDALLGAGVGAVVGEFFHKKVGMDDGERGRIHAHLEDGGAVLAVMADDDEVEATKAEIAALGGSVEHYNMPEDMMYDLEQTRVSIEKIHEDVTENLDDRNIEVQEKVAAVLVAAPSVGVVAAEKLHDAGVDEVEELQEKAGTEEGRAVLAGIAGAETHEVHEWARDIDLSRVHGMGPHYKKLLQAAGIATVADLTEYQPDELEGLLITTNEEEHLVQRMPSVDKVGYWIAQANELPGYLTSIEVRKGMLDADKYVWHTSKGDNPKRTKMDAVMFNRKEGYEVELMIQKICNRFGFETVEDVKRIEAAIANELPGNVRSQKNVYHWLVDYFEAD